MKRTTMIWIGAALAPVFIGGQALAAGNSSSAAAQGDHGVPPYHGDRPAHAQNGASRDAIEQVNEAQKLVAKMQRDPALKREMQRAMGILVMPDYGRAALVVGAHGGNGVLLVKNGGKWTGPALYNLGGVSVGLQAGASGGHAALLLMTDRAVKQFEKNNDFALNADAGLTVVAWSKEGQARTGGDVIAWSDQGGLFGGASIGVSDVNFDEHETAALYGRTVTASDVIEGRIGAPAKAQALISSLDVG